jgi:ribulose bisphosphate carboxylase small subunit
MNDDDDFFGDDSDIDMRQHEQRLAENELKKQQRAMWNQGYLAGLEWAEAKYLELELKDQEKE